MTRGDSYTVFFDQLLQKNRPFAAWSLPGETAPEILLGEPSDILFLEDFDRLNGQEGFVFAPFRIDENSPLILMKPGVYLKDEKAIKAFDIEALPSLECKTPASRDFYIIAQENYLKDIDETVRVIQSTKLSKVIVSRIIPAKRGNESIGELYMQLRRQTPNAMVYLVNLPGAGLWMGATPEVLLQSKGKTLETVSLAGTQSRRDDSDYRWHTKEIEEQAFVSRYMLDVFYKFNIHPYTTQGPETLESGRVAHLKTSFNFSAKKVEDKLGDFVAQLHPTPAVCGLPKSKAHRFISTIEKHDRRYYSGYLGPWRMNDCIRLFVNLRCMEITADNYMLYSGGGITARSVPAEEWDETTKKATTLLSAIEAVQTNDFNKETHSATGLFTAGQRN
ncbi:chorismate-binding protein [Mangrovibacterium marinum]|uniref:Isochorismate synthase n=1 Tax=Mangrovibacterium marinum TaxID=1639118 RepID=A0A2T5C632_9BACT|nr:chorismate-binding protein [Mangrovibacterium marinum]PTN10410.1 isochorismate synthase [Mangrovibacterium marinum]